MDTKLAILDVLAKFRTVNIVELMALASEVPDDDVETTVTELADKNLVSVRGKDLDRIVSMTSQGYNLRLDSLASNLAIK